MGLFYDHAFERQLAVVISGLSAKFQNSYPAARISEKSRALADMLSGVFDDGGNPEAARVMQFIEHSQSAAGNALAYLLDIAVTELYHIHLIGQMISSLGGSVEYRQPAKAYWLGGSEPGVEPIVHKLSLDVLSEQESEKKYEAVFYRIINSNLPGSGQVCDVLKRIIKDKLLHLSILKEAYAKSRGS